MEAFEISRLIKERERRDQPYLEFLRAPALSAGVYELAAGARDPQRPHGEDELYYVVRGRAFIKVGEQDREVQSGSIIFVAAGVEHRFHTIAEDLTVLVLFAPAEYSLGQGAGGTSD
jgi:quercetin dioxygenase-like cupin family protein